MVIRGGLKRGQKAALRQTADKVSGAFPGKHFSVHGVQLYNQLFLPGQFAPLQQQASGKPGLADIVIFSRPSEIFPSVPAGGAAIDAETVRFFGQEPRKSADSSHMLSFLSG
jgi:hypothetical protein